MCTGFFFSTARIQRNLQLQKFSGEESGAAPLPPHIFCRHLILFPGQALRSLPRSTLTMCSLGHTNAFRYSFDKIFVMLYLCILCLRCLCPQSSRTFLHAKVHATAFPCPRSRPALASKSLSLHTSVFEAAPLQPKSSVSSKLICTSQSAG